MHAIRALHKKMIENNECIKTWLENYKPETRQNYMVYAYQFFKWVELEGPEEYRGCTPQDLLDLQNDCLTQRDTFKQVELLKAWMRTMPAAYCTKVYMKSIIYGFYAYNHVPLPRDACMHSSFTKKL